MECRCLRKVLAISLILKISLVGLFDLDESEEDEDDLLQRTGNFISTSTSLPKGILKVRVGEVGSLPPSVLPVTKEQWICVICGIKRVAVIYFAEMVKKIKLYPQGSFESCI